MKKAVFFVVLAMVVISFCVAQSTNNDAQRIVGTWVGILEGKSLTYVFNTNGTGTITHDRETENLFGGVSFSGELFISYDDSTGDYTKFAMSPDGRRIFIYNIMFQKK